MTLQEEEPSYVHFRYLVKRPITLEKDPETMRKCREIIQSYFKDRILAFKPHSLIRLEDAGINIGIDKEENINSIKITFNILEENPDRQEWNKYAKRAWECQAKLLDANREQVVQCFLTFNLQTKLTINGTTHTDTIPRDFSSHSESE